MENQSKNPAVVILSVLVIACLIWGIVASASLSKTKATVVQLKQDLELANQRADQARTEAQKQISDADNVRRVALKWEMQRQQWLQQEKAKAAAAEEAAKNKAKAGQAGAKGTGPAAGAKGTGTSKPPAKGPTKPAKKTGHSRHTTHSSHSATAGAGAAN